MPFPGLSCNSHRPIQLRNRRFSHVPCRDGRQGAVQNRSAALANPVRRRPFKSGEPSLSSSAVVEMSVAEARDYMQAEAARRECIEERNAIAWRRVTMTR